MFSVLLHGWQSHFFPWFPPKPKQKQKWKVKTPLQKNPWVWSIYWKWVATLYPSMHTQFWNCTLKFLSLEITLVTLLWGGLFLTLHPKGERLILWLLSASLPDCSPFSSPLLCLLLTMQVLVHLSPSWRNHPWHHFMQVPPFFSTSHSLSLCFLYNSYYYRSHLIIY